MKNLIILIFAILTLDAVAVCTSPISRANNGANSVLTSAKYNLDINTVYNKVNTLPGDCIVDNSINGTKLIDASVTIDKMAANSVGTSNVVDGSITSAKLAAAIDNLVPVGTILAYAGATAPSGYLICNGASISRTTYARLYGVTGNAYGSADGVSFNLPDLRGRFVRGFSNGSGVDIDASSRTAATGGNAGDAIGSYQAGGVESHVHKGSIQTQSAYAAQNFGKILSGAPFGVFGVNAVFDTGANYAFPLTGPYGVGDTRPTNVSANHIIKY